MAWVARFRSRARRMNLSKRISFASQEGWWSSRAKGKWRRGFSWDSNRMKTLKPSLAAVLAGVALHANVLGAVEHSARRKRFNQFSGGDQAREQCYPTDSAKRKRHACCVGQPPTDQRAQRIA